MIMLKDMPDKDKSNHFTSKTFLCNDVEDKYRLEDGRILTQRG